MEIVRIIVLVLLIIYLLLAFVFVHISLRYRRSLKRSDETIYNLFAGQIALFALLLDEKGGVDEDQKELETLLEERRYTELNKLVAEKERKYQEMFAKKKETAPQVALTLKGLEENVTLLRNEIYRYNRIVENINVNVDSVIFSLFVEILRLKNRNKI